MPMSSPHKTRMFGCLVAIRCCSFTNLSTGKSFPLLLPSASSHPNQWCDDVRQRYLSPGSLPGISMKRFLGHPPSHDERSPRYGCRLSHIVLQAEPADLTMR